MSQYHSSTQIRPLTQYIKTPLIYAIKELNYNLVDLLLLYGANPNFKGFGRFTPLEVAQGERNHRMIQKLEAAIRVRAVHR